MLIAAALFAVIGCTDETPDTPSEKGDDISLAPEAATFSKDGGAQQVLVTSTGDWEMVPNEDYDWISADVAAGVDGDIVTFTAKENYTGEQLIADFTFTCGKATEVFTAVSETGEPKTLSLISPSEVEIGYASARVEIEVATNIYYRTLSAEFSGGADWIAKNATIETAEGAIIYFDVDENTGEDDRKTVITISGDGCEPVTVALVQRAEPFITPEKSVYYLDLNVTELQIPVSANVEYEVSVDADWLKYEGNEAGVDLFSMSAATEKRTAVVTMTEVNPLEGIDPTITEITVTQREAGLISWAVDMTDARLFPDPWTDPSPLRNMSEFTLEALICADNFEKGGSGTLSTIMGIEGEFLVRIGDAGVPNNQIQIATSNGNFTNADMQLETGKWYHLAVTFYRNVSSYQPGEIVCYLDGTEVCRGTTYMNGADFGKEHTNEAGSTVTRCFWIGYAYETARDFEGKMCELRIWNRALTADDLNETNHFYQVSPDSEGLVAYWKLNDGQGSMAKDYTAYGNNLTGQYDLYKTSGVYPEITGTTGIKWVEVSLPE